MTASKIRLSPIVVQSIRDRHAAGESFMQLSHNIENETGFYMSHDAIRRIVSDDSHIAEPPRRNSDDD